MITKKRQLELLDYAIQHARPVTERERERESMKNAAPAELTRAEVKRRLKALKREAKRGPSNNEERDLFMCFRLQLWENRADNLSDEVEALDLPAKAGRKVFNVQAHRRDIRQAKCRANWEAWQAWIDAACRNHSWSFPFAQRSAASHFKVSLKSIQRRTHKPGQAN